MAAHVGVVLEAHHQAGAGERIEDGIALGLVEPTDFHRARDAEFVTRDHSKQEGLQFVEAGIQHERSTDNRFLHDVCKSAQATCRSAVCAEQHLECSAVGYSDSVGKFYRLLCYGSARAPHLAMTIDSPSFDALMLAALDEARRARDAGEVPIGAVVAIGGAVVSRGFNQPLSSGDPTAHAEIVAIRSAARAVGNYRLTGSILCVTIEPCLMCVGALVHARIGTLVFGAAEPKSGAVISTVRGGDLPGHNHQFDVVSGVREEECRELMQAFFRARR